MLSDEVDGKLAVRYQVVSAALESDGEAQRVASTLDTTTADSSDAGFAAMLTQVARAEGATAFADRVGQAAVKQHAARGHAPDTALSPASHSVSAALSLAGVEAAELSETVQLCVRKTVAVALGTEYSCRW